MALETPEYSHHNQTGAMLGYCWPTPMPDRQAIANPAYQDVQIRSYLVRPDAWKGGATYFTTQNGFGYRGNPDIIAANLGDQAHDGFVDKFVDIRLG